MMWRLTIAALCGLWVGVFVGYALAQLARAAAYGDADLDEADRQVGKVLNFKEYSRRMRRRPR